MRDSNINSPMYYTEVNDLSYTIAIPQPTLTERLDARTCELCGKVGPVVMRHVRKLNQLKGKTECDRLKLEKHQEHWLSVKSVMPKYGAMLNKVMLSTESRMRGDMQVRFGGRYGKTYCKGSKAFYVPSLHLGKGGGVVRLGYTPMLPARAFTCWSGLRNRHRMYTRYLFFSADDSSVQALPTAGDSTAIVSCPAFLFTR